MSTASLSQATSDSTATDSTKPQRKTQAPLASDTGVGGGPAESMGSAKRQKIEDSSDKHHQEVDGVGGSVPPRNILRQGANNSRGPPESDKLPPSHPPACTQSSTNAASLPPPSSSASVTQQQPSPEDVLVRCMLQMAQQQQQEEAVSVGSSVTSVSTANSSSTTSDWSSTSSSSSSSAPTTQALPTPSSATPSSSLQRDPKSNKGLGSPNSVFSRGNFAPLDHLASSLSSSAQPPPKFQTHGKTPSTTIAMSGTITSSVPTMTSSTTAPLPPLSSVAPGGPFTNADLSRLIPHLEAIAGSLQNSPSLESHCLAALAQTHILPTLAGYDPNSPQAAQVLEALQSLPLVGAGKTPPPLPNASTGDLASFLAGLDMNALMQNLTGPELLALEQQSDGHSHVGYVTEGGKRSQRSVGGVGDGEQGEGSKVESDVLPSRTRPLTTSFLLDHNFSMDIPPPTDLLPEHVRTVLVCVGLAICNNWCFVWAKYILFVIALSLW